jgi:hypothetical protein
MDWKSEWTDTVRPHQTIWLHRPTLRGRIEAAARGLLRQGLALRPVRVARGWARRRKEGG